MLCSILGTNRIQHHKYKLNINYNAPIEIVAERKAQRDSQTAFKTPASFPRIFRVLSLATVHGC